MNPTLVIYQRLKALLKADAGITDVVTGFNLNFFDEDGATAATNSRSQAKGRPSSDRPSLKLELDPAVTGADAPATFRTRTGDGSLIDSGWPVRLGFRLVLESQSDLLLIALGLEQAVERALLQDGRTLGVDWVGSFQIAWARKREAGTNKSDWTSTGTITVTGRPKLSQLTA